MSSKVTSAFFLGDVKPGADSLSAGDVIGVAVMGNVPVCTGDPVTSPLGSCAWNTGDVSAFVMRCGVVGTGGCCVGVTVLMDFARILVTPSPSFVFVVSELILFLIFFLICVGGWMCLCYDKKREKEKKFTSLFS